MPPFLPRAQAANGTVPHAPPPVLPVTLAVVDVAGPGEFRDLVRAGLASALEALHPDSLFGLVAVSDAITLVDLAGVLLQRAASCMQLQRLHTSTQPCMLWTGVCACLLAVLPPCQ